MHVISLMAKKIKLPRQCVPKFGMERPSKKFLCRDIKERKRRRQLNAIIRPSTKSIRTREDGDQIIPMIQIKVTEEPNPRRSENVVPEIRVEEPTTILGGAPSLSEGTSSGKISLHVVGKKISLS